MPQGISEIMCKETVEVKNKIILYSKLHDFGEFNPIVVYKAKAEV